MKRYIYILTIAAVALSSGFCYAQAPNYKDIYEYVKGTDTILAYEMLKEYQALFPEHANTYYQLGLISQYWTKKYDALTQPDDVNYFLYHTDVYLNLSKKFLDDKEVKKNREYYQGVSASNGKKVQYEDVLSFIDKKIEDNTHSDSNIKEIQKNYIKCVDLYNQCVELFLDINKSNNNYKVLLLTVNDKVLEKISKLENLYDSTMHYLEKFESGIHDFQIKSYKQKHKVEIIETYRLEGLTYTNFLKQEFKLWDFGKWTKDFKNTLNADIKDIRFKIDSVFNKLTKRSEELSNKYEFKDSLIQTKIKPEILFKIGKYDFNSVIVNLLSYLESVLNFIEYAQLEENNINNPELIDLRKKAIYYKKLIEKKSFADSLKKVVKLNVNERSTGKYKEFIASNFKSTEGLVKYLEKQSDICVNNLNKYLDNYKTISFKLNNQFDIDTVVKMGKFEIPLNKTDTSYNLSTTEIKPFSKGIIYLAGTMGTVNSSKAFVSLVVNGKPKWIKTVSNKIKSNPVINLSVDESGCFLSLSTTNSENVENKITRFTDRGIKKAEYTLNNEALIRYLNYDDINQSITTISQGKKTEMSSDKESEIIINKLKFDTKIENVWDTAATFTIKGSYADVININQNYYVFSNSKEYTDIDGKKITASNGMNALLTIIDQDGKIKNMTNLPAPKTYLLYDVIKINNKLVNLLGVYGDEATAKENIKKKEGKLFYMLIDNKGKVLFK